MVALVLAPSAALASGCEGSDRPATGPPGGGPGGPPAGSAEASASTPSPSGTADEALVAAVLAELDTVSELVSDALRGSPRLRGDLRPLLALHRDHARVLGATSRPSGATTHGSRPADLDAVRRREAVLHRRLVDFSLKADSGALARVLASMSAAVSQRLVVLAPSAS